MGSAHSVVSETAIAAVVIAGASAVVYNYTHHNSSSSSVPEPAWKVKEGKNKKMRQTDTSLAPVPTAADPSPNVVALPQVIPGGFDTFSVEARDHDAHAPASTQSSKPKKKKKGKKPGAGSSGTPRSPPADAMSESSATAPESPVPTPVRPPASKSRKSSTPKFAPSENDEAWTRIDSRRRPSQLQIPQAEAGTSDAGITTTSITGNSSPVTERTDDEQVSLSEAPPENRRTLAERLLPKPRKTGVDDMLETPDYPTLARVMRIQPGPNDKPADGFSWGDYEDVDSSRAAADDADGEDEAGWGVVKGRSRLKVNKSITPTPTAPEALTKRQRQNAAKREAQKASKAEAETERQARLAKHQRELERAKIAESYNKSGKNTSGGMTAYVDENGKLVWK